MTAPLFDLPDDSSSIAEAADAYVRAGLAPIALYGIASGGACTCPAGSDCAAPGKHPIGNEWQKRATLDADEVRDRFRGHRGNIGIYLPLGGHVLIDADGDVGLATAGDWNLPPTLTQQSGSGIGAHYIYRLAPHQDASAITDRKVAPGLDVKVRGQFVAAPSRHGSGGQYRWLEAVAVETLPDWLYDRIRKPDPISTTLPVLPADPASNLFDRARAYLEKIPPAISGSGGHDQTFAAARALAGFHDKGLSERDAWGLLLEYNRICQPPWSERDLEHKWANAKQAHTKPALADRPKPSLRVVRQSPPSTPVITAPPADWRSELLYKTTRTGTTSLVNHIDNIVRILQLDPQWSGKIAWNAFRQRITIARDLPWDQYHRPTEALDYWTDSDATRLAAWLKRAWQRYGFDPSVTDCDRAAEIVAKAHAYHPVRDYLDSIAWDGTARLASFTTRYLGAEPTEYHRMVGRWWLISAVARIYQPGCKVDTVPILEGGQGRMKSTAIAVLAGEWFSDAQIDVTSKDAAMLIQGFWMNELAEVDALMKSEPSEAKQFFSRAVDRVRPPYMKHVIEMPRQSICVGTTNLKQYVDDPTGARRYLPIQCGTIDIEALRADRDQLLAEAVHEYQQGATWYPETEADRQLAQGEQETRTSVDSWEEKVGAYIDRTRPARLTTGQVLEDALGIPAKDWTRAAQMRVGVILQNRMGWNRRKARDGTKFIWAYLPPENI